MNPGTRPRPPIERLVKLAESTKHVDLIPLWDRLTIAVHAGNEHVNVLVGYTQTSVN